MMTILSLYWAHIILISLWSHVNCASCSGSAARHSRWWATLSKNQGWKLMLNETSALWTNVVVVSPRSSKCIQTGLLFYQLVPVQNRCWEIPAWKRGSLVVYSPGLCLCCHQPRQWDHWVWVGWEKPLQIIHWAQEKVTSASKTKLKLCH